LVIRKVVQKNRYVYKVVGMEINDHQRSNKASRIIKQHSVQWQRRTSEANKFEVTTVTITHSYFVYLVLPSIHLSPGHIEHRYARHQLHKCCSGQNTSRARRRTYHHSSVRRQRNISEAYMLIVPNITITQTHICCILDMPSLDPSLHPKLTPHLFKLCS
jgi:hypothetical protein